MKDKAVESYIDILTHKNNKGLLPRDDYKEVAVLALVLLGEVPPGGFKSWLKPGATHKARFLNFAIYTMKMYLFSEQMEYSGEVVNALQRMATFISLIYGCFFLQASRGVDAPFNDLKLHKNLLLYKAQDDIIATKSLEVLQRHGWYLDEPIVPFALFSEKLSTEEKNSLAKVMLKHKPKTENPVFEIQRTKFPDIVEATELEDLVGHRNFLLFSLLKVGYSWLSKPAEEWEDSPDFIEARQFVTTAKTVNDVAERAVKLMSDYAMILTKDEEKKQWILQGVAENRRKYRNFRKNTLNK